MTVSSPQHLLVVGGIREIHDGLLKRDCRITWFVKQSGLMRGDQRRPCEAIFIYREGDAPGRLIEVARALHAHDPFDAVCAFHDADQLLALALARALGLDYPYPEETIRDTRDKYRMRRVLRAQALCAARCDRVESLAGIRALVDGNPDVARFVVKPIDGTGSENVRAISRADLDRPGVEFSYPAIVEEFIEGTEYSVEALTHHGRHHIVAITEKFKDPESFIETGHLVPARIDPGTRDRIAGYVERCLTALKVSCGPTHTEVIVNGGEAAMIETHTRPGGDKIPLLVKYATGVDLYELTAAQAIAEAIAEEDLTPREEPEYACIRFRVQQPSQAELTRIDGVAEAARVPGIRHLEVNVKPGERLREVRHSFDRAAWALAVADSPDAALAAADAALDRIEFVF